MITNVRENEDIMKKLERVLSLCTNTRESVENIIIKYNANIPNYNESNVKEDLTGIAVNMDSIMKFVDPIFKHYLVLPNTVENDSAPLLLNTRKSDNLIKYESTLTEKTKIIEKNPEISYFNSMQIETSNSPNNNYTHSETTETTTKIRENMNSISRILSEKLKKRGKDITARYTNKKEEKRVPQDLTNHFNKIKSILNK